MLTFIKNLLGMEPTPDFPTLIRDGAVILDVRTKGEFAGGHVKGSINIPLDQLPNRIQKLDQNKPIVTCCASGMRSGSAKRILKAKGFEVYNGGGWQRVAQYK